MIKIAGLDSNWLKENWKNFEMKIKLDHTLIDLMVANAHYIIRDDENFKGKAIPDYKKSIDSSFLRAVAPERVEKGL